MIKQPMNNGSCAFVPVTANKNLHDLVQCVVFLYQEVLLHSRGRSPKPFKHDISHGRDHHVWIVAAKKKLLLPC